MPVRSGSAKILDAMDEGIEVFGASSMGALRAAELNTFGMVGHGTIFEWYRDGLIDGDDEVAFLHGPEELEFCALSEPLVNIRQTLKKAVDDRCMSEDQARRLLDHAKRTYYPERSFAFSSHALACRIGPTARISSGIFWPRRSIRSGSMRSAFFVVAPRGRRHKPAAAKQEEPGRIFGARSDSPDRLLLRFGDCVRGVTSCPRRRESGALVLLVRRAAGPGFCDGFNATKATIPSGSFAANSAPAGGRPFWCRSRIPIGCAGTV